ncbi:MAG: type IV pilin-like G/H family protein, partial [Phormidium sp.]
SNRNAEGMVLPFSFLISFLIESAIYIRFLKQENISIGKILLASFISNLVSYAMCAIFLVPFSRNSENFSNDTRPEFSATLVISYRLRDLESLYSEDSSFASLSDLRIKTLTRSYKFDIQSEPEKATIIATAKRNDIASLRGTIFIIKDKDKLNFIKGICKTDKPSMTPPEMPQLVKGEFQCPPGSLDKSKYFGLRQ